MKKFSKILGILSAAMLIGFVVGCSGVTTVTTSKIAIDKPTVTDKGVIFTWTAPVEYRDGQSNKFEIVRVGDDKVETNLGTVNVSDKKWADKIDYDNTLEEGKTYTYKFYHVVDKAGIIDRAAVAAYACTEMKVKFDKTPAEKGTALEALTEEDIEFIPIVTSINTYNVKVAEDPTDASSIKVKYIDYDGNEKDLPWNLNQGWNKWKNLVDWNYTYAPKGEITLKFIKTWGDTGYYADSEPLTVVMALENSPLSNVTPRINATSNTASDNSKVTFTWTTEEKVDVSIYRADGDDVDTQYWDKFTKLDITPELKKEYSSNASNNEWKYEYEAVDTTIEAPNKYTYAFVVNGKVVDTKSVTVKVLGSNSAPALSTTLVDADGVASNMIWLGKNDITSTIWFKFEADPKNTYELSYTTKDNYGKDVATTSVELTKSDDPNHKSAKVPVKDLIPSKDAKVAYKSVDFKLTVKDSLGKYVTESTVTYTISTESTVYSEVWIGSSNISTAADGKNTKVSINISTTNVKDAKGIKVFYINTTTGAQGECTIAEASANSGYDYKTEFTITNKPALALLSESYIICYQLVDETNAYNPTDTIKTVNDVITHTHVE